MPAARHHSPGHLVGRSEEADGRARPGHGTCCKVTTWLTLPPPSRRVMHSASASPAAWPAGRHRRDRTTLPPRPPHALDLDGRARDEDLLRGRYPSLPRHALHIGREAWWLHRVPWSMACRGSIGCLVQWERLHGSSAPQHQHEQHPSHLRLDSLLLSCLPSAARSRCPSQRHDSAKANAQITHRHTD